MSVIGTAFTLQDLARRLDPKGKVDKIVELLKQTNPILDDMMFVEGNDGSSYKTTVRTGLPTGTWRKLNYGVQPEKSTTAQVSDACGMLETYSEVDKALADMSGDKGAFLLSEAQAFLEGMNQSMASALFYGDSTANKEQIMGFAPRYNAYGTDKKKTSYNVIHGGGIGDDNTSIWLVVWGYNTVHGIYPKGSKAGLSQKDLGEATKTLPDGSMFQVYRSHYKWDMGLTVRDWRYVVRVANIDVSALDDAGESSFAGNNLINSMVKAIHKIPNLRMGRPAFYCNRTVSTALDLLANNKSTLALKVSEVDGQPLVSFRGIPVREVDAILDAETLVSSAA